MGEGSRFFGLSYISAVSRYMMLDIVTFMLFDFSLSELIKIHCIFKMS